MQKKNCRNGTKNIKGEITMKRSLKVLAMLVVATMLLSMAAFAAEVTPGTISHEEVGTDYTITVNYDASSYEDGDQVTMLVLTGSNEIEFAEDGVTPTNVGYIDQDEIEGATGSFTFSVAKDFVLNNEVYVKLGATAKTTAAEDTYTFEEGGEDPIDPPTPPADEDEYTITVLDVADAYGVTGLKIIKIEGADGTKSLSIEGAAVVLTMNDETPVFFAITAADVTEADLEWADVAPTAELIGNVNGDDGISIFDATAALAAIAAGTGSLPYDEQFIIDANTDGTISIFDATTILSIVAGGKPPVFAE